MLVSCDVIQNTKLWVSCVLCALTECCVQTDETVCRAHWKHFKPTFLD